MNRIITIIMYTLWILTIIAILLTTFTSFQYEDLNLIAGVLLAFAVVNTYFTSKKIRNYD